MLLPGVEPTLTYGIGEGGLAADGVELLPLGSRFLVGGRRVELGVPAVTTC